MRTMSFLNNKAFEIFNCEELAAIEHWFNYTQERKDLAVRFHDEDNFDNTYEKLSKDYWNQLNGARKCLESIGVKIAFDWAGHRGKWFFPTKEDVEMQMDWEIQCTDYAD